MPGDDGTCRHGETCVFTEELTVGPKLLAQLVAFFALDELESSESRGCLGGWRRSGVDEGSRFIVE